MKEATEIGLECLRLLRFDLASMEEVEALAKDSARVFDVLDRILSQGDLTDPYYLTVARVLICLTGCSFFHPSRVFSQIAHAQISVASSYGLTISSAFALSTYAHVLWGEKQPALCYRYGREALNLLERYGSAATAARAKVGTTYYGCICIWMEPLRVGRDGSFDNADLCDRIGDFEFSGYSNTYGLDLMLASGESLDRVMQKQRDVLALFSKRQQQLSLPLQMFYVCAGKLSGEFTPEAESALIDGQLFSPDEALKTFEDRSDGMFTFAHRAYHCQQFYFMRDFQRAEKCGEAGWHMFLRQGHSGAAGLNFNTTLTLYYALTLLALAPLTVEGAPPPAPQADSFDSIIAEAHSNARRMEELEAARLSLVGREHKSPHTPSTPHSLPEVKRSEVYRNLTVQVAEHSPIASASAILTCVAAIQSHIGLWATHNPHSYANKTALIDAERLRVFIFSHPHAQRVGPRWDLLAPTLRLYEKSISLAKAGGYSHEEALANELAARFCLQTELRREAEGYLRAAFWCYAKWGSAMKQAQLKAEFAHVFVHAETSLLSQQLQAGMAGARVVPVRNMQPAELAMTQAGALSEEGRVTSVDGVKARELLAGLEPTDDAALTTPTATAGGVSAGGGAGGVVFGEDAGASEAASWDHVDTAAVMKACMAFSVETDLSKLTRSLLWLVIQTAGASQGTLLLKTGDTWAVELAVSVDDNDAGQQPTEAQDPASSADKEREREKAPHSAAASTAAIAEAMPLSLFHLVLSTHQSVLLSGNDLRPSAASTSASRTMRGAHPAGPFASALASDPYLLRHRPKACLCVPILQQAQLTGLLYLANDHTGDSFTLGHVQILRVLTAQAALSIENARLYARVRERSSELTARNAELQSEMERRVAAQEAMRVAKEAAEKAAETKSAFLSNMSHEIRTPMNAVLGLSRLLQDTELTSEQSSYLTMITNSGKLLLTIINDVLDFSRIESNSLELEYRRFSLLDTLENATHLCFDMALKKHLDLAYSAHRSTPSHVFGDSSRLQQILLNLLSNACKFTPPGGQIVVSVHASPLDPSDPIVPTLVRATAIQALQASHSMPVADSDGSSKGAKEPSAALRARLVSQTPQPAPSRRLGGTGPPSVGGREGGDGSGSSSAQSTASSSSPSLPSVHHMLTRLPSQSAASSPEHTPHLSPPRSSFVQLHFAVRDTGLGMSEETQQRLFKSFSQGDPSVVRRFGGTGLGLAISKRLALAMHGEMWCESEVGKGSTFFFTIKTACAPHSQSGRASADPAQAAGSLVHSLAPAAAAAALSPAQLPSASPSSAALSPTPPTPSHNLYRLTEAEVARLSHRHVLLVSDLSASRQALSSLLQSFDLTVDLVEGGLTDAIRHVDSASPPSRRPQAIVLDYRGCSSSPLNLRLIEELHRTLASSLLAAGAAVAGDGPFHPLVVLLTTRQVGGGSGGMGADGVDELVKPSVQPRSAMVGEGKEDEEDTEGDESTGGSTTDEEAATAGGGAGATGARPHDEAELVGQLVLAKLSNLEHHQRKGDREHRASRRRARGPRSGGARSRRVQVPGPATAHGLHQPRPLHAGAGAEADLMLSPPSTALSPPLSPAPTPYASAAVRHASMAYQVRELTKPYRQGELLATLARWMEGGGGDEADDEGRWHGRAISAEGSVGSGLSGADGGDGSDGDGRGDDDSHHRPQDAAAHLHPSVPRVEREVQRSYNAVHAEREAAFPCPSRPADEEASPATGSGSDASSVSSRSSPLLMDVPTVTATLRKERGASSRSRHARRDRAGTVEEGVGKEPRLAVPADEAGPLTPSPSASPTASSQPLRGPTPPQRATTPSPGPSPALSSASEPRSAAASRVLAPVSRAAPRQAIAAIASDYPLSLLLAEDNPVNQKMMRMFLKKLGYDSELAVNGEEVLERMKAEEARRGGGKAYDAILMDVNMDGMDGIECTRRLRMEEGGGGARVFIVAQTANIHPESRQKCLDVGMNSFLPKPVILEELARQLKMAKHAIDLYDGRRGGA